MVIKMVKIMNSDILSGALNGKKAFAAMIAMDYGECNDPLPMFLDFRGVSVATASFLREAVIALKTYMRTTGSKYYPIVCNVNLDITEEFRILAEARNDAIVACDLSEKGGVSNERLIGSLDPKQAMTLKLVKEMRKVDAAGLMKKFGKSEKTTSTTAWNNRLAGLVARGLIREFSEGRTKYYRPLLEGI